MSKTEFGASSTERSFWSARGFHSSSPHGSFFRIHAGRRCQKRFFGSSPPCLASPWSAKARQSMREVPLARADIPRRALSCISRRALAHRAAAVADVARRRLAGRLERHRRAAAVGRRRRFRAFSREAEHG